MAARDRLRPDVEDPDEPGVLGERGAAGGVDDVLGLRVRGVEDADDDLALQGLVDGAPLGPAGVGVEPFLESVPSREDEPLADAVQPRTPFFSDAATPFRQRPAAPMLGRPGVWWHRRSVRDPRRRAGGDTA